MKHVYIFAITLLLSLGVKAQQIIQPDFLKPGDKIAILSPASLPNKKFVTSAEKVLQGWGYQTVRGAHVLQGGHGSFAGSKDDRKEDLIQALEDPDVKAIFCTRGGYGSIQEMQEIPFKLISEHPKWIIGYSDITVAHCAWVNSGVMSIHGHMGEHLMKYEGKDSCSLALKGILEGNLPTYTIPSHPMNHLGEATGMLVGGNLSVMCGTTGSYLDFFSRTEDLILFVEDVDENFDHVDRYLNLLKINGELSRLKGIIVGQFTGYSKNGDYPDMNYVFEQHLKDLGIPVIYNFPVGHVDLNYPLIEGATVHMKVGEKESAVLF